MIRLSIIIPFYNVERYIAQCLDSVFNQDIPLDEYEVICVNDGSPDHSRDIVLDYITRYPNIRLIEHEHNKKLGAARNTGRSVAQGTYIWNVDSDDSIECNCLNNLLGTCEQLDLDILQFGYDKWDGTNIVAHGNNLCPIGCVNSGIDYMATLDLYHTSFLCPVWNKIFRRSFLDQENIYSPEVNMGEDVPYSLRAVSRAMKISVVSGIYYLYRLNPVSLTGKDSILTASKLYEKCIDNSRLIVEVANEIPFNYAKVKVHILSIASYTLQTMFSMYNKLSGEEQTTFKTALKKNKSTNKHICKLLKFKKSIKYLHWLYIS